MSSSSIHNSQGIQILLEAEKDAKKIIADGREYRTRRLKEAKVEAIQEILSLKESKKNQVQETENKLLQETISKEDEIASLLIKESIANFESKKEDVIQMLLDGLSNISDPHPHTNWSSR